MLRERNFESRAIKLTIFGNLGMAIVGLTFAIITHSEAILLDGLFSLIAFAIALLTQKVSNLVTRSGNQRYPFGYAIFEPLLNLKKGLLVAVVCVYALISAVEALLEGGRAISEGVAIVYAGIAAVGCFWIAWRLQVLSRRSPSFLVAVDVQNWLIDGLISTSVAVTFILIWFTKETSLEPYAVYADPVLVIVLIVLVAPMPLKTISTAWNQIVRYRSDQASAARLEAIVSETLSQDAPVSFRLRSTEIGRFLYVHVYIIVTGGFYAQLQQQDYLRTLLYTRLIKQFPNVRIDLIFTQDPVWAERTLG
ncbi:MAG: cation transporter [Phormidesmis sp.]